MTSTPEHRARRDDFDIDAREAEILGRSPRITPLSVDDFDDTAKELVMALRESLGLNDSASEWLSVPSVFATMLKHPDLYRCQMEMGIQLLGKGDIPARDRELAILRVGWLCRAPYEWGQHVELAKRYGVSGEEIERAQLGSTAAGWSAHDAAILRGVEELVREQMISDATWEVLSRTWNERQLVEFPTLVGQYVAIAYSQNTLRIRLPPGNQGLRHR